MTGSDQHEELRSDPAPVGVRYPHAYEVWYEIEEKSGLRLLFETGRQHGVAVTETTRVIVKSILTAVFGSDGPRAGQETSR